ncbi:hypothetical protein ABW20_dc0103267 [Dactylellina cionopaga]|nr:hypothetical protein ABW20_dc0103267 [Dactylellina cionopaga]
MGIYTLNQKILIGSLPAGLDFRIANVTSYVSIGGYEASFSTLHNNIANLDGKCVSKGISSVPIDPGNTLGKTCFMDNFGFTAQGGANAPVYIGELKFSNDNLVSWPQKGGNIALGFEISSTAVGSVIASGSINVDPGKFGVVGRPDNLPMELVWNGGDGTSAATIDTEIRDNIGVDPGDVELIFTTTEDGESVGMTFTRDTKILNTIAGFGVEALMEINKLLLTRGGSRFGSAIKYGIKLVKGLYKVPGSVKKVDEAKDILAEITTEITTDTPEKSTGNPENPAGYPESSATTPGNTNGAPETSNDNSASPESLNSNPAKRSHEYTGRYMRYTIGQHR